MSKRNHSDKKAAVLNGSKSNKKLIPLIAATAVILITATAAYFVTQPAEQTSSGVSAVGAGAATTEVSYPVTMFSDGAARHFEFKAGGLNIRYFILKSSDGVIRAAFDACDVCWPAGRGYYQEGDDMVCRNCGRRFASQLVNEVKGGCNPAPLNRNVVGDQLVLKVEDILQGKSYFNFKKKA